MLRIVFCPMPDQHCIGYGRWHVTSKPPSATFSKLCGISPSPIGLEGQHHHPWNYGDLFPTPWTNPHPGWILSELHAGWWRLPSPSVWWVWLSSRSRDFWASPSQSSEICGASFLHPGRCALPSPPHPHCLHVGPNLWQQRRHTVWTSTTSALDAIGGQPFRHL